MMRKLAFVLVVATQIGGCLTAIAETLGDEGATGRGAKNAVKDSAALERKRDEPKAAGHQTEGLPPVGPRYTVDKAIRLADGDWLVYSYNYISDSGVQVYRMDPRMGKRRWRALCKGLGQAHDKFSQNVEANVLANGGREVQITSRTTGGWGGEGNSFEERLDAATGKQIERKVSRK
jgi:hypothetical protein